MTPEQVAASLEISRGTLHKLLKMGRNGDPDGIPSIRLASQVIRIPRAEYEAFLSRQLPAVAVEAGS